MNSRSFASKSLVLRCMPFMEKGAGSAWGLPVIATGKERFSALALSEKLEPPGSLNLNSDPLKAERLSELEALGIGPLGRYLGGEPIKPVPLRPEDFFESILLKGLLTKGRSKNGEKGERRKNISACELFCSALEFDDTRWIDQGNTAELFRGHLEFLRCWGFSGGLFIEDTVLPSPLADYIKLLQKESAREKSKIIVLVSKHFFDTRLAAELPNAKTSGDLSAGEIPVNTSSEGTSVWGPDFAGLGIAFHEDIAPMLRSQKIRCDICLYVITGQEQSGEDFSAGEILARLKLGVTAVTKSKQKNKTGVDGEKKLSLNSFLFRDLTEKKNTILSKHRVTPLAGIITNENNLYLKYSRLFAPFVDKKSKPRFDREDAQAFGLLSQWEAGRTEAACGCVFAVNTKFSGLRAADFKEEQAQFYREAPGKKGQNWNPSPIRYGTVFSHLNEIQLDFFLRWRGECRRGFVPVPENRAVRHSDPADSNSGWSSIESYILLYANELVLCMGREGPLQHFTALLCLFHACGEQFPETAEFLFYRLIDFAIVYGIASDAFPLLLDELKNNGWFGLAGQARIENEKTALLIDLAIYHFFVEKTENIEEPAFWPLIRALIPPKILARKEKDSELPAQCCRTLAALDSQLRRDWNRGFFSLFCPPLPQRNDFTAFENSAGLGETSYTVYRPGFTSHKPLADILSALALEPGTNPLPGVKARLHPLSLENELLEELRQESDAVRELLKSDEYDREISEKRFTQRRGGAEDAKKNEKRGFIEDLTQRHCGTEEEIGFNNSLLTAYMPPDKTALEEFAASLAETERNALKIIIQRMKNKNALSGSGGISELTIDAINAAFYERFKDILIETGSAEPSISAEYKAILEEWES